MKVTIVDSGFVSYDTIKPVGYAGEMNSRQLDIIHPHFTNCYYQIIAVKDGNPYTLGVEDGVVIIPPSLLRTAGTIECQFIAMSTPDSVTNRETDTFVFKSNKFTLRVDEGLNLGGVTPVPTYESLLQMQSEVEAAQQEVDNAIASNEKILSAIQEALDIQKQLNQAGLDEQYIAIYKSQLDKLTSDQFDDFVERVISETLTRILDRYPPRPCPISESCSTPCPPQPQPQPQPEIDENKIKQIVSEVIKKQLNDLSGKNWYSTRGHHSMSQSGKIIGG